MTWSVLFRAARLQACFGSLKLPDAIHVATAMAFGCSHVSTADKRLPQRIELPESRTVAGEGPWKGAASVDLIDLTSPLLDPLVEFDA